MMRCCDQGQTSTDSTSTPSSTGQAKRNSGPSRLVSPRPLRVVTGKLADLVAAGRAPDALGAGALIKAVLTRYHTYGLRMIQISKDDLSVLVDITDEIVDSHHRFIIYCDDLDFDEGKSEYRLLKSILEGTLEKPPENVLIYATSNCRLPIEQVLNGEPSSDTAVANKRQLADRFGLSLPFHPMNKDIYLEIVDKLFKGRVQDPELLHQEATTFATTRGGQSGRTARHFFNHCQTGPN